MSSFSTLLVQWYRDAGRVLPWRDTKDAYRVWLSEIILQQTRVEQGLPYYHAFVDKYGSLDLLALADDDEVMKLWQGLGYYSRARNMLKTARLIHHDLLGTWPQTAASLQRLPGIGPYTAAAIASFCFGEAVPVIDGNVQRVISRVFAISDPIDQATGKKKVSELAHEILCPDHPDEHNQAMMDLGATICTPQKPNCSACPVRSHCEANRRGTPLQFPIKAKKTKVQSRYAPFLVFRSEGCILMELRPSRGIWSGLWAFPQLDLPLSMKKKPALTHKMFEKLLGSPFKLVKRVQGGIHKLSHRELHIEYWEVTPAMLGLAREQPALKNAPYQLLNRAERSSRGVPKPVEKYLNSDN